MRTRAQKEVELQSLRDSLGSANSVLLADYRGLSVADANELRARLREAGGLEYRVAKNTLLRLACEGTPVEAIRPLLSGPTALAVALEEPSALARVLVDYSKDNERFEIKGGIVEGEIVDLDVIRRLAALPTRDELRGQLAGALQAPMGKLAGTLHSLLGHVRNALEQRQRALET
jgi:large subunit ribosomal protein L10